MKGNPIVAAQYLVRGFQMLPMPGIRTYVLIPLFINIAIFGAFISWGVDTMSGWHDSMIASIPSWLSFLTWLIWPFFVLMLLLVCFYTFTIVANFIAAPFNGFLAEKVENIVLASQGLKPVASDANNLGAIMVMVARSLKRETSKLLYLIPWVIALFLVTLIPGVNTFAPLLWFVFGAWMMSVQYVDYPMDNHNISMPQLRQSLRERRMSSLGFGAAVMVVTMIPVLNFFVIPAAICGATLFWLEELQEEKLAFVGNLENMQAKVSHDDRPKIE